MVQVAIAAVSVLDASSDDLVPFAMNTSASRVLSVMELLDMIISCADQQTVARAARVSKKWTTCALDHLWKTLDSIVPLLELLGPLTESVYGRHKQWELSDKAFVLADWDNFNEYARRVRSIHHADNVQVHYEKKNCIPHSTVAMVLFHRPWTSTLLPNLRSVVWRTHYDCEALTILPFLSTSVTALNITFGSSVNVECIRNLLKSVAKRTQSVENLSLSTFVPAVWLGTDLAAWVSTLSELKAICLPAYYQTQTTISALAKLPSLGKIEVGRKAHQVPDDTGMKFHYGKFPALWFLQTDGRLADATNALQRAQDDQKLNKLSITDQEYTSKADLHAFCRAVPNIALRIRFLCLSLHSADATSTGYIDMDSIRPLLVCSELHQLYIASDRPMQLTPPDVLAIGAAWPDLISLRLCDAPSSAHASREAGTSLEILTTVAAACRKLEVLGLYFSGAKAVTFDGNLHPNIQFNKLSNLEVGCSPMPANDPQVVAFFIGGLCARAPVVGSHSTRRGPQRPPGDSGQRKQRWAEMSKLMELVMRTKALTRNLDLGVP